jgi:hypothetical protein
LNTTPIMKALNAGMMSPREARQGPMAGLEIISGPWMAEGKSWRRAISFNSVLERGLADDARNIEHTNP